MTDGTALKNTVSAGLPDFPGQTDLRGQTFTENGPAQLVGVLKCESCGYSVTAGKSGTAP